MPVYDQNNIPTFFKSSGMKVKSFGSNETRSVHYIYIYKCASLLVFEQMRERDRQTKFLQKHKIFSYSDHCTGSVSHIFNGDQFITSYIHIEEPILYIILYTRVNLTKTVIDGSPRGSSCPSPNHRDNYQCILNLNNNNIKYVNLS